MAGTATSTGTRIGASASHARGRYVLGARLGKGGMAEVFAGQALGSHGFAKPVAIKRILRKHANDLAYVDRLIDEANLLVAMQHGNIVSVLDLVREGDDVFLVMEHVDGPSLRQLLATVRGPLPPGVATYVAQAAAVGLEFAHARPGGAVIHADISPSNLLLTTSGEVKVADFGIARREGAGTGGVIEGKWGYMAPEQARGEPLDVRADVFALGVVLYEMLTGVHPFPRRSGPRAADEAVARPPREVRPEIPAELAALCLRAVAHEPDRRVATMQELVDGIGELRFRAGWREGANELAARIRAAGGDRTGVDAIGERAVTILTRSLLGASESAPRAPDLADGTPRRAPIAGPTRRERPRPAGTLAAGTDRVLARGSVPPSPAEPGPSATAAPRRGPGVVALAIVACAVLAGIAAATWWSRGTPPPSVPPPPEGAALPPADPTPPPPTPTAASSPPVTAPAPAAAVAAPRPADPVAPPRSARPGRRPASRDATPARSPEPPRVTAPTPGTLRISAVPWAYVTVDGQTYETPVRRLELAPGDYVVKLHNPDTGQRQTRKVTIVGGKTVTLAVEMGEP